MSAVVVHRDEPFCYLTTVGRVTGRAHEIEIWFFEHGGRLYLLSGGADRSDWVRNIRQEPAVTVRLGDRAGPAAARVVEDPDDPVQGPGRAGLRAKYEPSYGGSLESWARDSLLIEVAPVGAW